MLLVFDLDETLTDNNYGNSVKDAWHKKKNYSDVRRMLRSMRKSGHTLAVLSRGTRASVLELLKAVDLVDLFHVVVGARTIAENSDRSDSWWGRHKTSMLHAMKNTFPEAGELVFFDDMMYNVEPARKAGFTVVHIDPPGSATTVSKARKMKLH